MQWTHLIESVAGDLVRIFQCSDGLETNQKKSFGWRYVSSLRCDGCSPIGLTTPQPDSTSWPTNMAVKVEIFHRRKDPQSLDLPGVLDFLDLRVISVSLQMDFGMGMERFPWLEGELYAKARCYLVLFVSNARQGTDSKERILTAAGRIW